MSQDNPSAPDLDGTVAALGGVDLGTLLHELPAVVFVAEPGPAGAWLYVSAQIEQMLGFTPAEWCRHEAPFATFVHPDDLSRVLEIDEASLRAPAGLPSSHEFRMYRRDGELIWIHDLVTMIDDPERGKLLQGLFFDITALRVARDQLSESDRLLRALIEVSPLAVMTWDLAGTILSWNSGAERIFGWTEAEAVGRFLPQVQESERARMAEFIERAFRGDMWEEIELVRQRKDGSLIDVSISSAALDDGQGEIVAVMSIISDITARKRNEELLRAQADELRQREQLDSIGKLAGGIAHDFNNLLTVIHGEAVLALEAAVPGTPVEAHLQPIVSAAEHATALTRQLLAFGRRQVLEPRVLQLNEVVAAIEPLLRKVAGDSVELRVELGDVPPVEADPSQLDQVLVNLTTNARDAMPRGGSIMIKTRAVASIRAGEEEKVYTLLSVKDTGTGMDESVCARVFDPFFTTKPTGHGSGLGLSTVYGIVAQSGGFIEVESAPGQGSLFTVHLPAARVAVEEHPEARPEGSRARPGGSESVLVVEDEPRVRDLLTRVLRGEGYRVAAAADAEAALARLAAPAERLDLLISDVVMPGMSGPELAGRVLERSPGVAVLFISGYNETAIAGYGMLPNDVDLLQKPFTPEALRRRVRAALDR